MSTTNCMYVTYVEKHGAFLKIWGQIDKNLSMVIENSLHEITLQFEQGHYIPSPHSISIGLPCCAKYKDGKYYRARVSNIMMLSQNLVEVHFIDYGNKDILPVTNIRTMSHLSNAFTSLPAQAHDFILSNVTHVGLAWDNNTIMLISNEIRYMELQFIVIQQINSYTLIKLFKNNEDFALTLFNRGLVLSMATVSQNMILQSSSNAQSNSIQPIMSSTVVTPPPTLLSYKAVTIEPGSENNIYISYVSDGPCQFSVQLQKLEESLARLMRELNRMPLHPLEEDPLPGTVCVAKCIEDDHICRAVVTSMVDGQYKVFYVDFGNTEVVPITNLFQIPFKYVILKVMAMRYALAGLERSSVTLEMKCAFKDFVSDKLLRMKSLPPPTRSALPLCELWDSNNINVLDVLKKAAMLSYPEIIPLTRGFNQEVVVSYVYSCSHFYVQLKSKEQALQNLMAELQISCPKATSLQLSDVKPGLPCCALFESDSQWYRAQILAAENNIVKVRYVDYGNEEIVDISNLRLPVGDLLSALRPQGLECCLNGYQNMEDDGERDNILEELILEKEFTMRVIEMQGSKALVDLIDNARYNVGSLLLERLASAKSQVSPLLIQESHHIEQRKRHSPNPPRDGFSRLERNNSRDNTKNWSRQDSFDKGFSPKESHDRGFNSRDGNRGFSRKDSNERFNQNSKEKQFFKDSNQASGDNDWKDDGENEFQPRGNRTSQRTHSSPKERDWNDNKQESNFNDERSNNRIQDSWRRDRQTRDSHKASGDNDWNDGNENEFQTRGYKGSQRTNSSSKGDWNDNKQETGFNDESGPNRKQESWRQDRPPRDGFKKSSWDNDGDKPSFRGKREGFRKGNDDFGNSEGRQERSWNKNKRDNGGGDSSSWKQRSPNPPKDSSEKSWSEGSEKSWRQNKGRNDQNFKKNDFGGRGNNRDFSKSKSNFKENFKTVEDPAEYTDTFTYLDVQGTSEEVLISWFHNPSSFYCQLKKHQEEFRNLMEDIQNTYCNIKPESVPVNAPAIAFFPEDNVLYRAYVNEVNGNQYNVQYVDFGNFATTSKVWRIEKKFMNIPIQAICCALEGIAPLTDDNTWTDIDSFSQYFDKESFICGFGSGENNGYLVNLICDDQNLSETLVSAGLAKFLAEEQFDSSILYGQQILVTIGEIESLNGFNVILPNGLQLPCILHNFESATETFEDTLKQYCNKSAIMYVDNVLEHALEVTLYDITGTKIKILEPDEGAFETVEPLCPLPVLSTTIDGWVSHLEPSEAKYKMFIQPSDYAASVSELLDKLFTQYDDSVLENPLEVEVGLYYAVQSSDTNWYRGLVMNVEDENVLVRFIDYGNTETVAKTELRELGDFKQTSALALEVLVADVDESYAEQEVTATVWYGETGWEATVVKTEGLQDNIEEVPTQEKPIESNVPDSEDAVNSSEQPHTAESAPSAGVAVCISHIDSPNEFYVQLVDAQTEIQNLQTCLQEQISDYLDLENPSAGVLCAAPYSVDQLWYRAQILDADNDITTVRFVDFGNTDVITNSTNSVKTLSPDMLALEPYARRCSLLIKPNEEEWSSAAYERFEVLTNWDTLTVEIIHQDEKTTYVEIIANEVNVTKALIAENLATNLELEIESSCTGYISNLNSPSEFWIQLENSVPDLEWVADQLLSANTFPELEDLTPGSLCAALYPEDEMWYRARILSNTVAGLEVLFVDYGNSCTCVGLRQLPEDLIMLPALAQKCSLQKPVGLLQWSTQATDKFKEISADGATIFNIDKLSTGETLMVKLLLDSDDISVQLLPHTVECRIINIESVDSFWIQKCADESKLKDLCEELLKACEWEKCDKVTVNAIVAALKPVDNVWRRAKVLRVNDGEYEVLYIDYGTLESVTEIRLYDSDNVTPLAKNCRLEPMPGFKWIVHEATEKLRAISNAETILHVEFGHEDIVRLYINGIDIRSDMDSVCVSSVQSTPKKLYLPNPVLVEKDLLENEFLELAVDSNSVTENCITNDNIELQDVCDDNATENTKDGHRDDENVEVTKHVDTSLTVDDKGDKLSKNNAETEIIRMPASTEFSETVVNTSSPVDTQKVEKTIEEQENQDDLEFTKNDDASILSAETESDHSDNPKDEKLEKEKIGTSTPTELNENVNVEDKKEKDADDSSLSVENNQQHDVEKKQIHSSIPVEDTIITSTITEDKFSKDNEQESEKNNTQTVVEIAKNVDISSSQLNDTNSSVESIDRNQESDTSVAEEAGKCIHSDESKDVKEAGTPTSKDALQNSKIKDANSE